MNRANRTVLMIEDNPADVESVRRALDRVVISTDLTVINSGVEAHEALESGRLATEVAPDLILLDLNVPGFDGRSFLRTYEENPLQPEVPLVVLTTSHNREDVRYAYRHGANAYVMKPSDGTRFLDVVESVCHYWFEVLGVGQTGGEPA